MINRGIAREAIFRDDRGCVHFEELLGGMSARYGLEVHAYVLMDNHYHVIIGAGLCRCQRGDPAPGTTIARRYSSAEGRNTHRRNVECLDVTPFEPASQKC